MEIVATGSIAPNAGPAAPAVAPATGRRASRTQRLILLFAVIAVLWLALRLFGAILPPFAIALCLAYILHPLCAWTARRGLGRGPAAALIVVLLIAAILLAILLLYPIAANQIAMLASHAPDYIRRVTLFANATLGHLRTRFGSSPLAGRVTDMIGGEVSSVVAYVPTALGAILGRGFAVFNLLSLLVVTPVVAFYLLRDWPSIVAQIDSWIPVRYRGVVRAQAHAVDRILAAWVRGQATCCLLLAAYYATALSGVGLELGLIVGLTAGLLSFIPYVGSATGGAVSIGLALSQFPTWAGVFRVIAVLVIGQILEGYVIYPRFLGNRVELPALWVIFALLAGGAGFGFAGVMLAVPAAATIGVLARFWLRRYLVSPLYLDPTA